MKRQLAVLAAALVASTALVACTSDPNSTGSGPGAASAVAQSGGSGAHATIPTQTLDAGLAATLPDKYKSSKTMTSVNSGSFPPYTIVAGDGKVTGATRDLEDAIGQLLGITIADQSVDGLASILAGMQAGRYDISMGPVGDFKARQSQGTFVDWVQEFVVFAVPKGNPKQITDLDSTCGTRIAVQAGGSAEAVIKKQSGTCTAAGKPAVEVQSYKDQPQSILAVQSGRADAFFSSQAPLTYFVQQSNGALQLAGVGNKNGFNDLFQGLIVPVNSDLAPVFLKALQELHANGTYDAIMDKWGLSANRLTEPGINLSKN